MVIWEADLGEWTTRGMTTGMLVLLSAVAVIVLIATGRAGSGGAAAARMSRSAKLPVGSDAAWHSIRVRARRLQRATMWAVLALCGIGVLLVVLTPWGDDPRFAWIVVLIVLAVLLGGAPALITARDHLFAPRPAAARVARASTARARDYLVPWARWLPTLMLVAAAAACAVLAATATADRTRIVVAFTTLVTAALVAVACLALERRVLARPQPAESRLDLAWDDLFRTDALLSLRMSAALASAVPLGVAVIGLSTPDDAAFTPAWIVLVAQLPFLFATGRLRARLYPEDLRSAYAAQRGEGRAA